MNSGTAEQETAQALEGTVRFPFKRHGCDQKFTDGRERCRRDAVPFLQRSPFSHRACGSACPLPDQPQVLGNGAAKGPPTFSSGDCKGRGQTSSPRTCFPRRGEVGSSVPKRSGSTQLGMLNPGSSSVGFSLSPQLRHVHCWELLRSKVGSWEAESGGL